MEQTERKDKQQRRKPSTYIAKGEVDEWTGSQTDKTGTMDTCRKSTGRGKAGTQEAGSKTGCETSVVIETGTISAASLK